MEKEPEKWSGQGLRVNMMKVISAVARVVTHNKKRNDSALNGASFSYR
jgi:hypothetical protein